MENDEVELGLRYDFIDPKLHSLFCTYQPKSNPGKPLGNEKTFHSI